MVGGGGLTGFFAPIAGSSSQSCSRALGCVWLLVLDFLMKGFLSLASPVPIWSLLLLKACLRSCCSKVPIVMFQIVMVSPRTLDERFDVRVTFDNELFEVT